MSGSVTRFPKVTITPIKVPTIEYAKDAYPKTPIRNDEIMRPTPPNVLTSDKKHKSETIIINIPPAIRFALLS